MNKNLKEEFEKELNEVIKTDSVEKIEFFLLNSSFKNFNKNYKQSVMDYFVCSGYENEKLAKWSLTNTTQEINGDIHENADRPLRLAAEFNIDFAKYLLTSPDLKEKANINKTNDGSSALLKAIKTQNLNFVEYLLTSHELKIKARLDIADKAFDDPLCSACNINCTEIIKFLLSPICYPNPQFFNAKINLTKFDFDAVNKIISNNNLQLFQFIVENNLLDIIPDLNNWFCKAIINDAVDIANYIEKIFETKPNLGTIQYKNHSLFFMIAKKIDYSRMNNHSYLNLLLENNDYILTKEEREELKYCYVYDENKNGELLSSIMQIYDQKHKLNNILPFKNIKEISIKI